MSTIERVDYMARAYVLSNGELHVGINLNGFVHDFYYPYVGLENHAAGLGLRHKIGVWVDGIFSWLDDGNWNFEFNYPYDALVGHTKATNSRIGIILEFDDAVDNSISVFMRNIHVINQLGEKRDIRLFMHQAFAIGDSRSNTDTAQYLPGTSAILHYRGRRAFIVAGRVNGLPFDQHSIGLFGIEDHQGTWKDAEDGELSGGNVEHGRVDSVIRFKFDLAPHDSGRVNYWIAAGSSMREALYVQKQIDLQGGMDERIHSTTAWWHKWLEPARIESEKLPLEYRQSFVDSVMIIKSQIDIRGAIMASTDTSLLNYSRDAYTYCWPRDGGFVIWPLIRLGYQDEALRFFAFCKKTMHPDGYLMHKYRADGAIGSSWHPYIHDDVVGQPIQEDETALVVFIFNEFYKKFPSKQLLNDYYQSMILPMANFMMNYIDQRTGLPRPSYDLWEEDFITTTYTTAVVRAALNSAAEISESIGDNDNAVLWKTSCDDITQASKNTLFNKERQYFYHGINVKGKDILKSERIDSSALFGAYIFGLFDSDSPEIKASIQTIKDIFISYPEQPGIPRYENDNYRREHAEISGNWWYICSLWYAQYLIALGDEKSAQNIINWTINTSSSTHLIGEQYDPLTGKSVAPAPLTWSHAEFVSTLLDIIGKD